MPFLTAPLGVHRFESFIAVDFVVEVGGVTMMPAMLPPLDGAVLSWAVAAGGLGLSLVPVVSPADVVSEVAVYSLTLNADVPSTSYKTFGVIIAQAFRNQIGESANLGS